jgi:hypothetical protein
VVVGRGGVGCFDPVMLCSFTTGNTSAMASMLTRCVAVPCTPCTTTTPTNHTLQGIIALVLLKNCCCPVDRAFLGEPRVMVRSFISGGVMAILFIFLFSFVGIFGAMEAVLSPGRCVRPKPQ